MDKAPTLAIMTAIIYAKEQHVDVSTEIAMDIWNSVVKYLEQPERVVRTTK